MSEEENNSDPIDDLVQVKSLHEEDFGYKSWTTVTRLLATGLQGVEMREMPSDDDWCYYSGMPSPSAYSNDKPENVD